jgi:hypothetical protein
VGKNACVQVVDAQVGYFIYYLMHQVATGSEVCLCVSFEAYAYVVMVHA